MQYYNINNSAAELSVYRCVVYAFIWKDVESLVFVACTIVSIEMLF